MFAVFENYIKGIRPVIATLVVLGGEYSAPLKYLIVFSRNFIAAILLESQAHFKYFTIELNFRNHFDMAHGIMAPARIHRNINYGYIELNDFI